MLSSRSSAGLSPNSDTVIKIWLAFNITGQWCLLALLATFFFVKHLPQRNNPFLINFILTTFLGTIPPALLFYTGHQFSIPSDGLCFAQAALVDGIAPMFGMAQLALVVDTLSELRSVCFNKRQMTRTRLLTCILILAPYVTMWIWTFASFIAASQSKATHDPGFVYCRNNSGTSAMVRNYVRAFMLVFAIMEICLEFCICYIVYRLRYTTHKDSVAWRMSQHFALRILALSVVQFIVISLSTADANSRVKIAYELLTSMNSLATFLTFGTQKHILRAWMFWSKTKPNNTQASDSQFQSSSMMGWANVREIHPMRFDEEAFERRAQHGSEYFKSWLGVGEYDETA